MDDDSASDKMDESNESDSDSDDDTKRTKTQLQVKLMVMAVSKTSLTTIKHLYKISFVCTTACVE